ncbi:hypothetical protein [Streptomyces sp. NBC_01497]|uniref:hypothetical protein n=1 Tax=Streptomyces sp. NBC_01497 TaxID=2903885 RepID=UPI002E37F64F|nr:hypothetical protein [Streptomyces sp. NBC_01497]
MVRGSPLKQHADLNCPARNSFAARPAREDPCHLRGPSTVRLDEEDEASVA